MGIVLETLVPLYLLVGLGLGASKIQAFLGGAKVLSAFVYYFAFPAFLFTAVAEAPRGVQLPLSFYGIAAVLPLVTALLSYWALRGKAGETVGAQIALTGAHGNVSYFGIPLCIAVFGPTAALPAAIGQLLHNLVFWIGYPLLRSRVREGSRTRVLLQAVPFNPAVIALALGLLVSGTGVTTPEMIMVPTSMLSDSAIPAALVSVGLAVGSRGAQSGWSFRWLAVVTVLKNIWLPLATLGLAKLCLPGDADGVVPGTLVVMAAMPTSVASYSLAAEHDPQAAGVAQSIVLSTIVGLLTIPWMTLLLG